MLVEDETEDEFTFYSELKRKEKFVLTGKQTADANVAIGKITSSS